MASVSGMQATGRIGEDPMLRPLYSLMLHSDDFGKRPRKLEN